MPEAATSETEPFKLIRCQSREEWLAIKNLIGVGGSSAAAALGESPYKSRLALWTDLADGVQPDEAENERMRWGNLLEPVVAQEYAARTGRELDDYGRFTIAQSTKWPWLYATLDRRIRPAALKRRGCLEIKCTDARMDGEWAEDAPVHHQIQLQTQLAVTGDEWGSIACCIGGNRLVFKDYERNENFITALVDACKDFVESVRARRPPPPDGSDSTREALKRLYGTGSTGETIEVPAEMTIGEETVDVDAELERVKAEMKRLETRKKLIENTLIATIGEAAIGMLPGGARYTLSRISVDGYVKKVEPYSYLRLNRRVK